MRMPSSLATGAYANGASTAAGSTPSAPRMTSNTMAQSSTLRQMGPILSIDHDSAMAPLRLTAPKVGRSPVVPQRVDGDTIEPHVSVPMANATNPAAVAEADPADEPLDPSSVFQGLRVMPPNHTSPHASSP